jgi:hypothetical protein
MGGWVYADRKPDAWRGVARYSNLQQILPGPSLTVTGKRTFHEPS